MAVKVADTIEPMGSFPAVAAQHTSVTINGASTDLQSAIDNGQIGKQDLVYIGIPDPPELRKSPLEYYMDTLIEYSRKKLSIKFFIEYPLRLKESYGTSTVIGFSFNFYDKDSNSVCINGLTEVIKFTETDTECTFRLLCYNPIEINLNTSLITEAFQKTSFYIEFTYNKNWKQVDNSSVSKNYIIEGTGPAYLSAFDVPSLFEFTTKANVGKIYEVRMDLSETMYNEDYNSIEESSNGFHMRQYMLCTNVLPGDSATFVSLSHNVEEASDSFTTIQVYNYGNASNPDMRIGWVRDATKTDEFEYYYEEAWDEDSYRYRCSLDFSGYNVGQFRNLPFEITWQKVIGYVDSIEICVDDYNVYSKYSVDSSLKGFIISGKNEYERVVIEEILSDNTTKKYFIDCHDISRLKIILKTNVDIDQEEPDIDYPEVVFK